MLAFAQARYWRSAHRWKSLQILLTNRQVYEEASHVLHSQSTYVFDIWSRLANDAYFQSMYIEGTKLYKTTCECKNYPDGMQYVKKYFHWPLPQPLLYYCCYSASPSAKIDPEIMLVEKELDDLCKVLVMIPGLRKIDVSFGL